MTNGDGGDATDDNDIELISTKILELVHDGGHYVDEDGHLSLSAGHLIRALHTVCNVSMEKFPIMVLLVVNLLFGEVSSDVVDGILRASRTYTEAMKLSGRVSALQLIDLVDKEGIIGHLVMDASNKKKVDLITKLCYLLKCDETVVVKQLGTHQGCDKKSKSAAEETLANLQKDLGQSVIRVLGETIDGASAAKLEGTMLLGAIDALCAELPEDVKEQWLVFKGIKDMVYNYSNFPRMFRQKLCNAHNWERVLERILRILLRSQGLGKNATEAQELFSIHYNMDKFHFLWLTIVSLDMDDVDPLMTLAFKAIMETRWVTREKAAQVCLFSYLKTKNHHLILFMSHLSNFFVSRTIETHRNDVCSCDGSVHRFVSGTIWFEIRRD